jgi:hypothetical protein
LGASAAQRRQAPPTTALQGTFTVTLEGRINPNPENPMQKLEIDTDAVLAKMGEFNEADEFSGLAAQ